MISNGECLDETTKKQIYTDIYDDSMWLINLVENLLAVTRIEEGKMNLKLSAELMDEVVAEALRHINRESTRHIITVESREDFIFAKIDARLIVQVIINIVDNAVKFTPKGSHISITTAKKQNMVVVDIADNGPGISEDEKPHVFDMFYSGANRVADSRRSLGLGLSLCKSIVNAHGGQISVQDNVPCGRAAGCAYLDGEELHLTPIEYKLLCLLSKNVGKVLTHTFITQKIWGSSWENDIASLRVFMATLRRKVEPASGSTQYIQTHIGVGYRMLRVE